MKTQTTSSIITHPLLEPTPTCNTSLAHVTLLLSERDTSPRARLSVQRIYVYRLAIPRARARVTRDGSGRTVTLGNPANVPRIDTRERASGH